MWCKSEVERPQELAGLYLLYKIMQKLYVELAVINCSGNIVVEKFCNLMMKAVDAVDAVDAVCETKIRLVLTFHGDAQCLQYFQFLLVNGRLANTFVSASILIDDILQ